MNNFSNIRSEMDISFLREAIELELKRQISRLEKPATREFHNILFYHMGWSGEGAGQEAQGKRLRPILFLLTALACSHDQDESKWRTYLPAAAAIELIHNFSLIHDDIQDKSELRRGRTTAWVKWGMPQAINAGDALFVLANQSLLELKSTFSAKTILKAQDILQATCLDLTRGQFQDMAFERIALISIDEYWQMVTGKTAALFSACSSIGSLLGEADENRQEAYRRFGHYLGLAFQVQDDILGIWGDEALTGKSNASDIMTGKKSLPILLGLSNQKAFAQRWQRGDIREEEIPILVNQLTEEGVRLSTQRALDEMMDQALVSLRQADPLGAAGEALFSLTQLLIDRKS